MISEARTLLNLSSEELKEREDAIKDYFFYLGECEQLDFSTISDQSLLGQSWICADDLDYIPSQVIDNKVKALIGKQARFMFGKKPDILLKPVKIEEKDSCEALRRKLDKIFKANHFWSNTLKAFKLATITKKVLLRLEANPSQPVKLYYHDIKEFKYAVDPNDLYSLVKVVLIKQDSSTATLDDNEKIWYRYTYTLVDGKCMLKTEKFNAVDLSNPIEVMEIDTKLTKIPCWIIVNEQGIGNSRGLTDIKDLKPLQNAYNRRLSDFNDALRFTMFGQTVVIDAEPTGVNDAKIAPNAIMALVSNEDKTASAQKLESSFTSSEPAQSLLKILEDSMYEKLSIPRPENLQNVPSAKALKFLYSELEDRCEEKWNDWEPAIEDLIETIIDVCQLFKCYSDWDNSWNNIEHTLIIKHNYAIPEDEEDTKNLAMSEVKANVRSIRSYIRDFSDEEDPEAALQEILEDVSAIYAAENEQMTPSEGK